MLTQLDTENAEQNISDEVGNLFSNKPEIQNATQRSQNPRYNLRQSPRPSVRLHATNLLESQPDLQSILKPGYRLYHVTIDDLLILDNSHIRAFKKAVRLHKAQDSASFAVNHPNLEEILGFHFKNGISTLLTNFDRWLPINTHDKRVSFKLDDQHRTQILVKSAVLTLGNVERASFFCTSLRELHLCK